MRQLLLALLLVVVVGCGNSDTAPDEQPVKPTADAAESTNAATHEPQDASHTGDSGHESVAAGSGDAEEDPRWYERFVVSQDNQRALQSGTIKARETVTIDLEAKNKRHIGFGTNVFQDDIRFADGETITFHQTKGAKVGIGVTSTDGNGGGQEFTPVDGVLSFQLENKSNHTLKYVIYEFVGNEEAVPHPTSGNATNSQSQTPDGVPVVNSIGMRFVPISAGTFTMGEGKTAHKVTLTQAFELGQHEVTQEQYEKVMGKNPSKFKGKQNPVEMVSSNDAVEFCRKLSELPAEKAGGYGYRLPTEAEWEYACRAGTTTRYSFGDDPSQFGEYAWFVGNSRKTTHSVNKKKPNPWRIYDLYGNVEEWCSDFYGELPSSRVTDPKGPSSGRYLVFRGGGAVNTADHCRSATRSRKEPTFRNSNLGFRVVRSPIRNQVAKPGSKPAKAVVPVVNSIGMRFVNIPSGKFNIGGKKDGPQVTLSRPFQMGQYEVTQEQYQKVMGTNPSRFSGPQHPVERVNWYDAVDFCRKLSELPEEKKLAYVYRLPTQAEWEYAGRAGATTVFSFGDSDAELGKYAWYSKNSGFTTHPVGEKNPNVWGLHDMHGNVQEWCQDNVMKYSSGVVDPIGNAASKFRCLRGGMWLWGSDYHRFTYCPGIRPNDRDRSGTTGFRVVRTHVE